MAVLRRALRHQCSEGVQEKGREGRAGSKAGRGPGPTEVEGHCRVGGVGAGPGVWGQGTVGLPVGHRGGHPAGFAAVMANIKCSGTRVRSGMVVTCSGGQECILHRMTADERKRRGSPPGARGMEGQESGFDPRKRSGAWRSRSLKPSQSHWGWARGTAGGWGPEPPQEAPRQKQWLAGSC